MYNILNLNMEAPQRPGFNQSVRKRLAKEVAKQVKLHTGITNGYHDLEADLFDLFCDQWHCMDDGYELAKTLDNNYGYSPTTDLVEALDCSSSEYSSILEQQDKEWVLAYNVKLELPVGDEVSFKSGSKKEKGIITRLFSDKAKYGIWNEELGLDKKESSYYVVEFEKVEKL